MTDSIPSGIGRSPSPVRGLSRLDKIHEEIAWHQAQITLLKAEANSLCTILNLPTEITFEIFRWHALESNRGGDVGWTKIMLVCRRWHDIALADHQLWRFIYVNPSSSIPHVDRRLQRSGAAPLVLRIEDINLTASILPHLSRLCQIDLTGAAWIVSSFVDLIPAHTFPLLHSVILHCTQPEWGHEWALLDAVFDGRAPQLTALHLWCVSVNWELIRGLTSLILVGNHEASATFETLLSVLAANAFLEDLTVGGVINPASANDSLPIVNLPFLKSLRLGESTFVTNIILRHVTFPVTACLSVGRLSIRTGDSLSELLGPLRRHLRAPSAPIVGCLRLECLSFQNTFTIETNAGQPALPIFSFGAFIVNDNLRRRVAIQVLKLLPRRTIITYLDARTASLSITSWRAALNLLPALEVVLTDEGLGAGRLFQALTQLCDTSPGRYPHLRRLQLSLLPPWVGGDFGDRDLEYWFAALRDLLNAAHAHELALKVLDIEDLTNRSKDLPWDTLRGVVGKIMLNYEELHPVPGQW